MSSKEQLDNINRTVFEKLSIDNPLYRYPTIGQTIGFYPEDKTLPPQKASLKATHNFFYAMQILASADQYPRTYVYQSIKEIRLALEIILDHIKEIDPDIVTIIFNFFSNTENKEIIQNALQQSAPLNAMRTTQEEINDLTKLLYQNSQIFSEASPALKLAKLYKESESYYYDNLPVRDEFFNELVKDYGVSSQQIEEWKNSLLTDRDNTLIEIRKKINTIGLSRFGSDIFYSALEDARDKKKVIPNPVFKSRKKPSFFKKTRMRLESLTSLFVRSKVKEKSPFSHLKIISTQRLLKLRDQQKSLDILYVLEHKDPKHRTKDVLLVLWGEYKKEKNIKKDLDFKSDYQDFFDWVDKNEANLNIPRVTYLNLEQQKLYKANLDNNAVKIFGGPADTSTTQGDKPGFAAFVMDNEHNVYIAEKERNEFQHSSFLSGADVSCAGLLKIKHGKVIAISNESGHYKPDDLDLAIAITVLRDKNILAPNFVIVQSKFPFKAYGDAVIDTPGLYWVARALKGYKRKQYVDPNTFVNNVLKKYSLSKGSDTYSQAISYLDKPSQPEQIQTENPQIVKATGRKPRIRWPNMRLLIKAKSNKSPEEKIIKTLKNQ